MSLQGLAKLSGQAADKDILTVEYFILGEELILYKKEGREETGRWSGTGREEERGKVERKREGRERGREREGREEERGKGERREREGREEERGKGERKKEGRERQKR